MLKKILSFLVIIPFTVSSIAQDQDNDEVVEEIVTVGTKASLISAIDKQRDSNLIVSVVDSDALGDFPDTTAAEAIRRLSGITVENDQGEGRYVNIRGISGDLNSIAVNGALVPAPEGGRTVMLDGLPTELLDSIEVYKSLTADKDADSIGGRIEFNTKRATDLDGTLLKLKLDTSYNTQSKSADNPKLALTYGSMINDTVGHVLGVTYSSKEITTYNNETGFPAWDTDNGNIFLDDDWEMRFYGLTRERTGLTYDIDMVIDDKTNIYANFLYNHYEDDELRNKEEFGSLRTGDVFADSSEINRIRRDAEVRKRIETRDIRTVILGVETIINDWSADIQFSHSYAEENDTDNVDVTFRSERIDTDDCGGPCGSFIYTDPELVGISLTEYAQSILYADLNVDAWEEDWSLIKDTETAFSIDMTKDGFMFMDAPTTVKYGFKYRSREKKGDNNGIEVCTDEDEDLFPEGCYVPELATVLQSDFSPYTRSWPFAGQAYGPHADENLLYARKGQYTGGPNFENYEEDFTTNEDILALYLMGTIQFDKATVIAGIRVENTDYDTLGYNDGDVDDVLTASKSYTFVSPSINVKYFLNDYFIFRGAIWRALSRPGFDQANLIADISERDDGNYRGEMGNPDLDPYEATNFDLSLEYYGNGSFASLGYFKKDIENAIYPLAVADTTVNGLPFDELLTFVNTDDSEVDGFEMNLFQELNMLPAPFDGLFISMNFTKTKGTTSLAVDSGTVSFPFRKLSEDNANISIGYDKNKFDIRLSRVSRSPYLDYLADDDSETIQEDLDNNNIRYTDHHDQLDFNLKYKINDQMSLKFDISNITDEPEFYYWGTPDRLSQYDLYGRTYSVGIRYNL